MALAPYVMRYRGMVAGAVIFLGLAAATTLALPVAVRQMVDHGFKQQDGTSINTPSACSSSWPWFWRWQVRCATIS